MTTMNADNKPDAVDEIVDPFIEACQQIFDGDTKVEFLGERRGDVYAHYDVLHKRLDAESEDKKKHTYVAMHQAKQTLDGIDAELRYHRGRIQDARVLLWGAVGPAHPSQENDRKEDKTKAKRAIVECVGRVNRGATEAALLLGKFVLRTPKWSIDNHAVNDSTLEGFNPFNSNFVRPPHYPKHPIGLLPDLDFDPTITHSGDMFKIVDNLIGAAASQDYNAIMKVLQLLTYTEMGGQMVIDHLYRKIAAGLQNAEEEDEHKMREHCCSTAVTAWFPRQATYTFDPEPVKLLGIECDADGRVTKILHDSQATDKDIKTGYRIVKVETVKYSQENLARARDGTAVYRLTFVKEVRPEPYQLLCNIVGEALGSETNPHDSPRSREAQLANFLHKFDRRLAEMAQADPLLHVTTEVVEALLDIGKRAVNGLRREEHIILDVDGLSPTHWFDRRKAAHSLCQQAVNGNILAIEIVIDKVMSDGHWMIRQVAAEEACNMLVQFEENVIDDQYLKKKAFEPLTEKIAATVYSVTEEMSLLDKDGYVDVQQTEMVRSTAEEALIRAMQSTYPAWLKAYMVSCLIECHEKLQEEYGKVTAPILQRILKATGSSARKVTTKDMHHEMRHYTEGSKLHKTSMREERKRQEKLDQLAANRRLR